MALLKVVLMSGRGRCSLAQKIVVLFISAKDVLSVSLQYVLVNLDAYDGTGKRVTEMLTYIAHTKERMMRYESISRSISSRIHGCIFSEKLVLNILRLNTSLRS